MSEVATKTGIGFSSILQTNKQELAKIEQFRKEPISVAPRNLVFGGLALGGVFVTGLFALQIITGILAIVTTAVAGVGAWFGLRFLRNMDPVIRQKAKNLQIDLMVKEARKNATVQLDNQVIDNAQRLENARDARDQMGAAIETMRSSIDPSKAGTPMHTRKTDMLDRVQAAYELMCENLDKGALANKTFKEKVGEYKEMEKFSTLAAGAMSFFDQGAEEELNDMLSLEAFGQIESDFNTAIISIENSAKDMALDAA
jgi:uncharacterized membrane protein